MGFNLRRSISPVILAFVLAGCGDSTKPIDLRVGLFVAGEDQLSARLHNPSTGIKESELRALDKALKSAITKAFRRVFASVDTLKTYPTQEMADNEELDLIVVAELMGTGGTFGYQSEGLWNRGESDYFMSVELTFYTRHLSKIDLCSYGNLGG